MSEDIHTLNFQVRTGLKAGAVFCYQAVNGYLVPLTTPYVPPESTLPPLSPSSGPWLTCSSCTGTHAGEGQLTDATCEVCNY
jgi:hypothetical protein